MKVRNNIHTRIFIAYPTIILSAILVLIDIIDMTGYLIICGIVVVLYIIAVMIPEEDVNVLEGEKDE